jgi:hypothetical protein
MIAVGVSSRFAVIVKLPQTGGPAVRPAGGSLLLGRVGASAMPDCLAGGMLKTNVAHLPQILAENPAAHLKRDRNFATCRAGAPISKPKSTPKGGINIAVTIKLRSPRQCLEPRTISTRTPMVGPTWMVELNRKRCGFGYGVQRFLRGAELDLLTYGIAPILKLKIPYR